MKGKYRVVIRNQRVVFTIDLERNITVIRGDSATGKTTLVQTLLDYEEEGENSGIRISCPRPCYVLHGKNWEELLKNLHSSIVFIDEGNRFISSREFAEVVRNSDNYYVLITRESLYQLPYSVNAVLELRRTTSRFKVAYNKAYPYYDYVPRIRNVLKSIQVILTEDTNAGFELFTKIAEQFDLECISSNGKTQVFRKIQENESDHLFVVADGAAFGAEMDPVYRFVKMFPERLVLYLPESFEWLILKAGIISDPDIQEMLQDPSSYIESARYFSWEQFFTDVLVTKTRGTYAEYKKTRLSAFYLRQETIDKIIDAIENRE